MTQAMLDSRQSLGMSHEQIAARLETTAQPVHNTLLGGAIEIHHHVTAEDEVKLPAVCDRVHEVETPELNCVDDLRFEAERALLRRSTDQKSLAPGRWEIDQALLRIHRLLGAIEDSC